MKGRNKQPEAPTVRCAIYTRKSTVEGLEQEFNSRDAQRGSSEAYIAFQSHEGQLFLRGAGDQQQQGVVQILHRDKMPKALVGWTLTSFLGDIDSSISGKGVAGLTAIASVAEGTK